MNVSANAVVPNDGRNMLPLEIDPTPGKQLELRIADGRHLVIRSLRRATTGPARFLRIGIDHYDSGQRFEPVMVIHDHVVVTSRVLPLPPA